MKIEKTGPQRVELHLQGKLTAESMRQLLEDFIAVSDGIEDGTLLYVIEDFEMPSARALAVEMRYLPKLFSLIGRYKKCAVLSDVGWIRTVAVLEGKLIPGLEIQDFAPDERDEAEAWLEAA